MGVQASWRASLVERADETPFQIRLHTFCSALSLVLCVAVCGYGRNAAQNDVTLARHREGKETTSRILDPRADRHRADRPAG
jgi:hypothetical protein